MQRLPPRGPTVARSKTLEPMRSFTRYEPVNSSSASPARSRATSLNESHTLGSSKSSLREVDEKADNPQNDIFERHQEQDEDEAAEDSDDESSVPDGFDELPVEIQSLMERFLESLTAKVHPSPLSIDRLAELFQDFYEHTQSHINTHIAALQTKISREQSPTPSVSSFSSGSRRPMKILPEKVALSDAASGEQQMLTASEISGKRKARKQLVSKRLALEEGVERSVCTKVYPRLWRHKSTDDEEKDEKLRSRAAALSLVGIGLKELLSTSLSDESGSVSPLPPSQSSKDSKDPKKPAGGLGPAEVHLTEARDSIRAMNDSRYPLGKLNCLVAAHGKIVDALQQLFPSTSSADEVLPTLIYTIITSPPESLHVISNLHFVQRFRNTNKINGEAAYCLTNLEAAISFVDNVDLASLRREEARSGRIKTSSSSSTPQGEKSDPLYRGLPTDPIPTNSAGSGSLDPNAAKAPPAAQSSMGHARRLSNLINRPKSFDNASDVVISTAQPAIDSIQQALDGSFKFLFGRLREKQATDESAEGTSDVVAPKTLEDAKKLVSPIDAPEEDPLESLESVSNAPLNDPLSSSNASLPGDEGPKLLELISGKRSIAVATASSARERSADSNANSNSPKKTENGAAKEIVSITKARGDSPKPSPTNATSTSPTAQNSAAAPAATAGFAAVESMRNLGSSLNSLKSLTSGMGMMRGFGGSRQSPNPTASAVSPPPANGTSPTEQTSKAANTASNGAGIQTPPPSSESSPDKAKASAMDLSGIAPPLKRFVDLKEPRELTFYDVELLLREYQRLSGALRAAGGPSPI